MVKRKKSNLRERRVYLPTELSRKSVPSADHTALPESGSDAGAIAFGQRQTASLPLSSFHSADEFIVGQRFGNGRTRSGDGHSSSRLLLRLTTRMRMLIARHRCARPHHGRRSESSAGPGEFRLRDFERAGGRGGSEFADGGFLSAADDFGARAAEEVGDLGVAETGKGQDRRHARSRAVGPRVDHLGSAGRCRRCSGGRRWIARSRLLRWTLRRNVRLVSRRLGRGPLKSSAGQAAEQWAGQKGRQRIVEKVRHGGRRRFGARSGRGSSRGGSSAGRFRTSAFAGLGVAADGSAFAQVGRLFDDDGRLRAEGGHEAGQADTRASFHRRRCGGTRRRRRRSGGSIFVGSAGGRGAGPRAGRRRSGRGRRVAVGRRRHVLPTADAALAAIGALGLGVDVIAKIRKETRHAGLLAPRLVFRRTGRRLGPGPRCGRGWPRLIEKLD